MQYDLYSSFSLALQNIKITFYQNTFYFLILCFIIYQGVFFPQKNLLRKHFSIFNKTKPTRDTLDKRSAVFYSIIQGLHPLVKETGVKCLEIKVAKLHKVF